ncbi:hypothetical protein WR25_08279 isoform A [Diploscapter pachys]|uniref:Uncharacterized protein n=1 Tax=Diploscapter pachys TaxID=2018661 RepID=A0A2A2LHF5_9BILA|nr:hypothetical protein WR25_08279 isoform A [Diploscapter pachys]
MTCLKCGLRLEANKFQLEDDGQRVYLWACPNAVTQFCDFPLDMPTEVFWVKATPEDQKRNYIPPPQMHLMPLEYRHLYPSVFRGVFYAPPGVVPANLLADDVASTADSEVASTGGSDELSINSNDRFQIDTPEPPRKRIALELESVTPESVISRTTSTVQEEEDRATPTSVGTGTISGTVADDLESEISDDRSSRNSYAPVRTITQQFPAKRKNMERLRRPSSSIRYSQPNNAFARDTVGDIYAKFHKQGLSEEAVGANEAMDAIYSKLVESNFKQRKTASPRVDEFNNLYRERVCKVDYNKVKKKFEEKSRPGLMAVLQLTSKIRNAQDAREVFNAIGVERTATTPTNMKGHVQNRLSNKYNEMMVQAKLNEERQQIEKELALSQKAAEEEANRLANENPTSKPISEKHISTVRRMIEKKKAEFLKATQTNSPSPAQIQAQAQAFQLRPPQVPVSVPELVPNPSDPLSADQADHFGDPFNFYQPIDLAFSGSAAQDAFVDPFASDLNAPVINQEFHQPIGSVTSVSYPGITSQTPAAYSNVPTAETAQAVHEDRSLDSGPYTMAGSFHPMVQAQTAPTQFHQPTSSQANQQAPQNEDSYNFEDFFGGEADDFVGAILGNEI